MNRAVITATMIAVSLGIVGAAQAAGDAAAGKTKSARCAACHGPEGKGVPPNPALAAKPEAEQVQALKDCKSGTRNNAIMKGMAASLSDQDMDIWRPTIHRSSERDAPPRIRARTSRSVVLSAVHAVARPGATQFAR